MKKLSAIATLLLLVALVFLAYFATMTSNFKAGDGGDFFYISAKKSTKEVVSELKDKGVVKNAWSLELLSKIYKQDSVEAGAFRIDNHTSNLRFLRNIYQNRQTPVKFKINNIRLKSQLCSIVATQTNIDSAEFHNILNDSDLLKEFDKTSDNILTLFIPNTYEVYWTISPKQLLERMQKEYNAFWTPERRAKAAAIPLTETEVAILASIVEEESNNRAEQPTIAGLYINRLKQGMKLQADPTARYALGDFSINQVYHSYTRIDSPYNTYRYAGLPPGPIRIASIAGIDAVLNYEKHNYIFMCAKPELDGTHNFAATYAQHQKYAALYYKALKEWKAKKGIE